ncbi:hypothetical protein BDV59DRAFT_115488 [Aspergillus ambiguus]|uniref:uncharacterized protein n=1 Tax=Aspergillus ambiguus TaxID=176160 RepID=UPI003CCC90DC
MFIYGYAYKASSPTDYLAVGLLLLHILTVIIHIIIRVWRAHSSDSWESISKLAGLLHNSQTESRALVSSSAGVQNLYTYGKVGVIRVVEKRDTTIGPMLSNVEMVFGENLATETFLEMGNVATKASCSSTARSTTWPLMVEANRHNALSRDHTASGITYSELRPDELYGND